MLWDVSLMKFIYEVTQNSFQDNVHQFGKRGLLNMDSRGIPADARIKIEKMFHLVEKGEIEPIILKAELDRWNAFDDYQDRFLSIFKRGH